MMWEKKTIGELCIKVTDGSHYSPKEVESGFPMASSKDMCDNDFDLSNVKMVSEADYTKLVQADCKPLKDDILIIKDGNSYLKYIFAIKEERDLVVLSSIAILRPKNDLVNSLFFQYLLRSPKIKEGMKNYISGSAIPRIVLKDFKRMIVEYPPLSIQRKIATILSAYDDLIENNMKRIKLLEEAAFLRYKGIVKSEKLTEGCVRDLADVKSGFAFKGSDWTDKGFPVIKIRNIDNNDIDLTNCSHIPENIAETASKFKLNAGELLIAMTGATVGKIGMMPKTNTNFYLNQRVGIFRPKSQHAELFLFCFFNEASAKTAVENLASGAAQPNISGGQIESIKLFYPKFELIEEFGQSIINNFELIWNLKQQNSHLRTARDILLPRLMNGEIAV